MEKKRRDVIVSRFQTFIDEFRFDDYKAICNLAINYKQKTIRFTLEEGDAPSLYVILTIMSINKTWIRVLDGGKIPADISRYFLLTRWISFEASNYYLCHEENGIPIIDKCLVKYSDDGSINLCNLSPLDYLLLVEYDSRFGFTTPKSRIKELRESYEFRYLK